jgi:hypothetical protein
MTSFFVDLLLDYEWYSARGGQVPRAHARSSRKLESEDRTAEFWFYGEGEAINHVRIVFEAENAEQAQDVVSRNIAFWRDAIAVTSVISTSHYTAAQTLGANSTLHPVLLGDGDVNTPLFGFKPVLAKSVPANYEAAAHAMANWRPEFKHHLHFLAKFLDPNLPADVRWLHGYRFLEWHFERGGTKLATNNDFRAFIEERGSALDVHKPHGRTRVGFLEEIRAVLAHALLADRPTEDARTRIQHAVMNTFAALESFVISIMNDHAGEGIKFAPKPPLEPPDDAPGSA